MAVFPSFIFDTSKGETPQSVAMKRALAAQIMGGMGNRPARNVGEGIGNAFASLGQGITANVMNRRASSGEEAGQAAAGDLRQNLIDYMTKGSSFPAAPNPGNSTSMASMPAPDYASARVAQAHGGGDLRSGIVSTAEALGIDPVDLATAISYETAGTFDPTKAGPTTKWGQHRGFIQFGEPQAQKYGVDWDNPVDSQLGPNGAVANYLRDTGVQPGMGLLDIYSAINAGGVGRYNRSDANNGGAPGTVADKVNSQMAGHRQKALSLLGDATPSAPSGSSGLTPEALQAWGANAYAPARSGSALDAVNNLAANQPVGVAETEADIIAQEQAMMGQDPQAFQQPGGGPPVPQEYADMGLSGDSWARMNAPDGAVPPMPAPQTIQDRPIAQPQPMEQPFARNEMSGQADRPPQMDIGLLMQVLSSPFMDEGTKAFAQAQLQQYMQAQDPMHQLDMEYKRAQIGKMTREAEQGGNEIFGTPIYGRDPETGQTVLGAMGKDGKFHRLDTAGIEVTPGVTWQDFGTHRQAFDKSGAPVGGPVTKENYQESFDKGAGSEAGKAQGEAMVNLPTDLATADQAITELDALISHPGLSAIAGPVDQFRPSWTMGAEGRDALARFNQAKGRAFLQAFGMLKGGGQITEIEGLKAEQAMARMDRAQSEPEFVQALTDFRDAVAAGRDKLRQRAGQGGQSSAQPAQSDGWQDMGGVRIRRKQ